MDVVLSQYCDTCSQSQSIIDDILQIIIGVSIPLIVFYLTIRYDKKKDDKKKDEIQQEKLLYFASLIKGVVSISEIQNNFLIEFLDKIHSDPLKFHPLRTTPLTDLERIVNRLNLEEYFLAYTSRFKNSSDTIREYKNIISDVDFLFNSYKSIVEYLEKRQKLDHGRRIKIEELHREITSLLDTILTQAERGQWSFGKDFLQLHSDFVQNQNDKYDLQYYHDSFLAPVNKLLIDYMKNAGNRRTHELLLLHNGIRSSIHTFVSIPTENLRLREELLHTYELTFKSTADLKKSSARLQKILDT